MPKTLEQRRQPVVEKGRELARKAKRDVYNSTAWQTLRLVVLAEEPVCYVCHERPSVHVDHKQPLEKRPDLALVRENLGGICDECHGKKTREEGRAPCTAP